MLPELNLPSYEHRISRVDNELYIFDPVRKKNVALTPEEWVRQNFIRFLSEGKKYPLSRMAIEKQIVLNGMQKRCDIVYYNKEGKAELIVECKAPTVEVSQATFDQAARYNIVLQVPILIITNGIRHFCCRINHQDSDYQYLAEVPTCE